MVRLRLGVHNSYFAQDLNMEKIYRYVEDIVTLAEVQDGFYEVEVTVLVRRSDGSESDFIRMQLDSFDSDKKNRQLTVKSSRNSAQQWF